MKPRAPGEVLVQVFSCRAPVATRDDLRLSFIPDHGSLRFVGGLDLNKPAVDGQSEGGESVG